MTLELTLDARAGEDRRPLYEGGLLVFTERLEPLKREGKRIFTGFFGGDFLEDPSKSFTVPIEESVDVR